MLKKQQLRRKVSYSYCGGEAGNELFISECFKFIFANHTPNIGTCCIAQYRKTVVNIYCNIPPLYHYISNHLTSATICLSYPSNYVIFLVRIAVWLTPPSSTLTVTTCQSVHSRDCFPSYYLLRLLYKPCAFQLIITLQLCNTVKRTTSS